MTKKEAQHHNSVVALEFLSKENLSAAVLPYIQAFRAHPWHEEFECSCGHGPFFLECSEEKDSCSELKSGKTFLIGSDEQKCDLCGSLLVESLKPTYTFDGVHSDFLRTSEKEGFIGVCAKKFKDVVAVCLGYSFPQDYPNRTGSTWYAEAKDILEQRGFDSRKIFYHNESFTIQGQKNKGVGTMSLSKMLIEAKQNGLDNVAFRTINVAMNRCYEKVFSMEKGSLMPLFSDPNPEKRQKWYVLSLNKLAETA